jgi:hypothetical protein
MSTGTRFLLGFGASFILLLLMLSWPTKEEPRNRAFRAPPRGTSRAAGTGLGFETKNADLPPEGRQPGVPPLQ